MNTIYLAGGCFWGLQKFLDQFDGVEETEVGYANGPEDMKDPCYEDVCRSSGHAETVRVVYNEEKMPLDKLLDLYFMVIDPCSVNRQGNDCGIQYRTGIYYINNEAKAAALDHCSAVSAGLGAPVAVEVLPLRNFYPAEEYHQKYLDKNPHGYCHIPQSFMRLETGRDA